MGRGLALAVWQRLMNVKMTPARVQLKLTVKSGQVVAVWQGFWWLLTLLLCSDRVSQPSMLFTAFSTTTPSNVPAHFHTHP